MAQQYLDVFLYGVYVGSLCSDRATLSFTYDQTYLQMSTAVKLSVSLPLQVQPFNHIETSAFFSGLLPDEYVRQHLARYLQLSEKNTFALLKEIGGECAGAVSVYPAGITPNFNEKPTYRILTDHEAHVMLSSLDKRPMWVGTEDVRISGAGSQDKMMIALVDGHIAIPTRNTPSTHIIKPAIKNLDESVQNEFFCMQLAKAVGLPTPAVQIRWIEGEAYYLIERYDRVKNKTGTVMRLHQEDMCQAMHIPPEIKYENEGGPNFDQCFSLLDKRITLGVMPGKDKITFLEGILFNFLIGNGDAHGKNFSLLYHMNAESLAPFYDLMSTVVYSNAFKAKMAMKIGGQYKFEEVAPRHIEKMGMKAGFRFDFVIKKWLLLSTQLPDAAHALCEKLNQNEETAAKIYEKIVKVIERKYPI